MSLSRLIENTPPVLVLGLSLFIGIALILASAACGTSIATFSNPSKQLGYFYEINWSLNFILFVPLAVYFFASSFNCVRTVIRDIADAKMIVNEGGKALSENELLLDWRKVSARAIQVGIALGLIGVMASWCEWWIDFNYLDLATTLQTTQLERGWNLAPLVRSPPHHLILAKIFGLAAFTAQGMFVAAYVGFLCVIFGFATWLYRFTTDLTKCELVPDLNSPDPRRGFENFESLVETLLSSALCCFGVFFLTRLDHAFLNSRAIDLGTFVQSDIWAGFINGVKDLGKGSATLFEVGDVRYGVAMVGAGLVLSLVTSFFIPAVLLRQAAGQSKRRARHRQQNDAAAMKSLDGMTLWPMSYPRPIELLGFLFLAAMCFVYFKLTLLLIGAALAIAVTKFAKAMSK